MLLKTEETKPVYHCTPVFHAEPVAMGGTMAGLGDYIDVGYLKSQEALSTVGLVGSGVVLLAAYNLPQSKTLLKFTTYAFGAMCLAYHSSQLTKAQERTR